MPKNQKLSAMDKALLEIEALNRESEKRRELMNTNPREYYKKYHNFDIDNPPPRGSKLSLREYEDGGDVKRPGSGFKPMDMGMDIFDAYYGNTKDTTVKGGGTKKGGKKESNVSPRKAQGMMYGGAVKKRGAK